MQLINQTGKYLKKKNEKTQITKFLFLYGKWQKNSKYGGKGTNNVKGKVKQK